MDIGSGGTNHTARFWEDYQSGIATHNMVGCIKQECIYPGGTNTHRDIVGRYECRTPSLHNTGIVAWVKAKWFPNNYTGMFQKADFGFARWGFQLDTQHNIEMMMYADAYRMGRYNPQPVPGNKTECDVKDCYGITKPPRYSDSELEPNERPDKANFMALKFLRDGVVSASVHTGTLTMGSWNHLGRWYSNLIWSFNGTANDTTPDSMSHQGAQRGTAWPGFTGLHDMAMYDQQGQLQHDIRFPYQLIFQPTAETQGVIPDSLHGSYAQTLRLAADRFKPGTVLYDIYVKDSFASPAWKIGELQLDSNLMLSQDADRHLFFYHPRYDRDIILRPDLGEGFGCKSWWNCPICPIFPQACTPDLGWLTTWSLINSGIKRKDGKDVPTLEDFFPAKENRTKFIPPKCGRAGQQAAAQASTEGQAGGAAAALIQRGSRLHRAGGLKVRQPGNASADFAEMRADDWVLDSRSGLLHPADAWCASPTAWPTQLRPSTCAREPVSGRPHTEPEWAIVGECNTLPTCDKQDGSWYSSTYPCTCGSSTCISGQLCMLSTNTCTSWGPWALAAEQGR